VLFGYLEERKATHLQGGLVANLNTLILQSIFFWGGILSCKQLS